MRHKTSVSLVVVFIIAFLSVLGLFCPTLGKQVPFNKWVWNNWSVKKIRYYMSEDLKEKLDTYRPTEEQIIAILGDAREYGGQFSYRLKTRRQGEIWYLLDVEFDQDGNYISSRLHDRVNATYIMPYMKSSYYWPRALEFLLW